MHRIKLFIPLLIFVLLGGFFWVGLRLDPTEVPSAVIDRPFPSFQLSHLDDEQQIVGKEIFTGQISLVNVWATWCISCRIEHPFLNQLKQQGVTIFGINYKDDSAAARAWLTDLGNPYQLNIVDKKGRLGIDLGVTGAPETYIVDQQGMIRFKHTGVIDERGHGKLLHEREYANARAKTALREGTVRKRH